MTIWLRQSTAVTVKLGPFVDETDGKTAETGLTISQADVRLSKNGGDMAQKNNASSCTHDEIGQYDCPLSTTDTNTLGVLRVMVHESGALPVWADFMVVPANVWDSLFGADYLQVDAIQLLGTAVATPATAGLMDVNVKQVSGDATAADNLELMFDGTGYAGGTTKLGVNAAQISGDATAADTLESIIEGATALAVNATQIGGSATAATNAARGFQGLVLGTAVTGTLTATGFTTSLTEATNDHYNGRTLTFTSGALAGQMTTITDYNGTTKVVTVTAMTEAPANGDAFFIA